MNTCEIYSPLTTLRVWVDDTIYTFTLLSLNNRMPHIVFKLYIAIISFIYHIYSPITIILYLSSLSLISPVGLRSSNFVTLYSIKALFSVVSVDQIHMKTVSQGEPIFFFSIFLSFFLFHLITVFSWNEKTLTE